MPVRSVTAALSLQQFIFNDDLGELRFLEATITLSQKMAAMTQQ